MDDNVDQKQEFLPALLGACVGLGIAIIFYLFIIAPVTLIPDRMARQLFAGLVIGAFLGGLLGGACGGTRQVIFQIIGGALDGGVACFILFSALGLTSSGDEIGGMMALAGLLAIPSLVLSSILGAFFGAMSNLIRVARERRKLVSAVGTVAGASLGWLAVTFVFLTLA